MLPKWHILYGYSLALVLIYFFQFSLFAGFIVFLASITIDVDHFFIYVIKTKNFSVKKAYYWHKKNRDKWIAVNPCDKKKYVISHYVFHGLELILILILLSYIHDFFFWALLGAILHLILDYCEIISYKSSLVPKISQIWLWQRNKNKKPFV
jgi:hypothetical protein